MDFINNLVIQDTPVLFLSEICLSFSAREAMSYQNEFYIWTKVLAENEVED